jgi:hypothetical protein
MKRIVLALMMVSAPASAAVDNDPAASMCVVKGKASIGGPLFGTSGGGTPLLTLSSSERLVEAYELPADPVLGRTRIRARRTVPGIRVDGYIAAKSLTYSVTKEQVVVSDHVWIAPGASLKLFQSATDLQGEPWSSSIANVRTRIACEDLHFGLSGYVAGPKLPRFYFKHKTTQLYDAPGGKLVFTINLLGNPEYQAIGSVKKEGAFHLIEMHDDVKVVGWVRAIDIEAEKPEPGGSMLGALSGIGGLGGDYAAAANAIKTVKFDTDVYLAPNTTGPSVGVLEKGAQVLVHPVANGFSTITLFSRDVLPPDGKEFHVLTSAVQ